MKSPRWAIDAPEDSDFFEGEKLGLQWQWNANYREDWYSLGGGQLTLYAQSSDEKMQLCDVPNLLLQKWPAPQFQITACIHLDGLQEGDAAGMVSQCGHYTGLLVQKKGGKLVLQQRTGNWTREDETRRDVAALPDGTKELYLRMSVKQETEVSYQYSLTGEETYIPAGETVEATPGRWVGVKAGLTAIHEGDGPRGSVAADYFVFEEL